jgi:alkanesulfonate monooxygenase SsuD/methylene tetrahydromethanopterin reductase-like flavin-dependent oxidoreductase (luciferase family)
MNDDSKAAEGYARAAEAMQHAAHLWVKQHPFAELQFASVIEVMRRIGAPPHIIAKAQAAGRPVIASALTPLIDHWGQNEDTRQFLRALDAAAQSEGTFLMAHAIVSMATERALERSQGQMVGDGWVCANLECGTKLDGYTDPTGQGLTPEPGSLTVCWSCGALQEVMAPSQGSSGHFALLSTEHLNRLPKSTRMQLMSIRQGIVDRLQKERARS